MKLGRYIPITVVCKQCGKSFETPKVRLKRNQGKFCSFKCSQLWHSLNLKKNNVGKENAFRSYSKTENRWIAYWFDESGKRHSTSLGKWLWEMNIGPVPKGYVIYPKDEDRNNMVLENLELRSVSEETAKLGRAYKGKIVSEKSKKKMSDSKKIAYIGNGNPQYIDGRSYIPYTQEFYEKRQNILKRDKHTCQKCGIRKWKGMHVHHIDLNKENNDDSNLITLCPNCHSKLHHGKIAEESLLETYIA